LAIGINIDILLVLQTRDVLLQFYNFHGPSNWRKRRSLPKKTLIIVNSS